jgi:hypothetical protein
LKAATAKSNPQVHMRALVASLIRREPPPDDKIRRIVTLLLEQPEMKREDRLDFLRILLLCQKQVDVDADLRRKSLNTCEGLSRLRPRHSVRAGAAAGRVSRRHGLPRLVQHLGSELDEVTQFHVAQTLSKLDSGLEGRRGGATAPMDG